MHNSLVKCALQLWSISILTFGELVWVKGEFLLTSDYHLRGFITSTLLTRSIMLLRVPADSSASSPLHAHSAPRAVTPEVSKPKSFTYCLFSISMPGTSHGHLYYSVKCYWEHSKETICYANHQAFGGLRQGERQLLLWEQCRKTNQLSGLKSWAINSSFNYPEQNFINICKLHPTYFCMKSGNPWELSLDQRDVVWGNCEGQRFKGYFEIIFLIRSSTVCSAVCRWAQERETEIREGDWRETQPVSSHHKTQHGRDSSGKRSHPCLPPASSGDATTVRLQLASEKKELIHLYLSREKRLALAYKKDFLG